MAFGPRTSRPQLAGQEINSALIRPKVNGFWDRHGLAVNRYADLLLNIVSSRSQQNSTIITTNGDHAARRLIEKDTSIVRLRPALDGPDWNDMLIRDRAGEPLGTDDRPIA